MDEKERKDKDLEEQVKKIALGIRKKMKFGKKLKGIDKELYEDEIEKEIKEEEKEIKDD